MKLTHLLESWRIVQAENRLHRVVLIGLVITNGISALAALRTERAVVLVPPNLTKEVEITRNTAWRAPGVEVAHGVEAALAHRLRRLHVGLQRAREQDAGPEQEHEQRDVGHRRQEVSRELAPNRRVKSPLAP